MVLKKKTAFVIGAGASVEYGYPTGEGLRQTIINIRQEPGFNYSELGKLLAEENRLLKLNERQYGKECLEKFTSQFLKSGERTIDGFLSGQALDTQRIGKFAIAYALLKNESDTTLFSNPNNWCQFLWQNLRKSNGNASIENLVPNYSFITFNYDTTIEQLFYNFMTNKFPSTTTGSVRTFFQNLPIFHIHGKIKNFFWEKEEKRSIWGDTENNCDVSKIGISKLSISEIWQRSQTISTVDENKQDEILNKAKQYLLTVDKIVFLGFGFDARNIEKLDSNVLTKDTSDFNINKNKADGKIECKSLFQSKEVYAMNFKNELPLDEIKKIKTLKNMQIINCDSIKTFLDSHKEEFL